VRDSWHELHPRQLSRDRKLELNLIVKWKYSISILTNNYFHIALTSDYFRDLIFSHNLF